MMYVTLVSPDELKLQHRVDKIGRWHIRRGAMQLVLAASEARDLRKALNKSKRTRQHFKGGKLR